MSFVADKYNYTTLIRRFGNLTAASTSEVLVCSRGYTEQGSEAGRSVKSSSASDSDGAGTGARVVRITYLNSAYVLKTEDVAMNGTNAVNTAATDIRFIESFEVIKGTNAVGAISLMTTTGGGGSEFAGISASTTQAFLCHHYTPAGKQAWIVDWSAVVDDESSMKLLGQVRPDGTNLIDRVFDLEKLFDNNPAAVERISFDRELGAVLAPEKSYTRVTVVPNQSTSTVIRASLYLVEESLTT